MRLKTKQPRNIKGLIIILLFIPISMISQDNKDRAQILVDNFIKSYNNEEYNSVFKLFSSDLKKELPIIELTDFLQNLNSDAGKISNNEFIRFENNIWVYKLTFEKWISQYSFYVNENNEISDVFYFDTFKEDIHSALAVNNLSNKEKLISDNQIELIFEKSKFFPNNTQISFAFINGKSVSYYGVIRQNDSITYINNSKQIFEIGSITKVFTANILANAVIENKIKLDDNINDYLNLEFNNNTQISFKSLGNHTSGLARMPSNFVDLPPSPDNPYKYYDENYLEDFLINHLEIDNKNIGNPTYSNLGMGLLGYTLTNIYNLNYEDLFKKYIFSKHNMKNSTFDIKLVDEKIVKGLDAEGNFTSNWELAALASAGGILSSVSDLAKYGIAHFDKSNSDLILLTKKTVKVNNQIDMGLGWHILNSESSENKWHWHNGGTGGYTSSMAIDIKNKTGVIILSNVSAFNPFQNNIDELCFGLMMTFTDKNGKPYYN
tara:strand:- start:1483 stop:2958 length:1476 start_codon:yes stop_codon:yes gene_type:complete